MFIEFAGNLQPQVPVIPNGRAGKAAELLPCQGRRCDLELPVVIVDGEGAVAGVRVFLRESGHLSGRAHAVGPFHEAELMSPIIRQSTGTSHGIRTERRMMSGLARTRSATIAWLRVSVLPSAAAGDVQSRGKRVRQH